MPRHNAKQFWLRYKESAVKDLTVNIRTKIPQSTLSTWKTKGIYPRADVAVEIASLLNTSVEYLVTGKIPANITCSPTALEIAIAADQLNEEGINFLKSFVSQLKITHSKKIAKSS